MITDNGTRWGSLTDAPPAESALDDLFLRDEILQVLFWYKGEGFGETYTTRDLQTFLTVDTPVLAAHLARMAGEGYLEQLDATPEPRYAFTAYGEQEGARRFADEFAGLTGQAHGDCPPNCPHCKDLPADQCVHCRPRDGSGSGPGAGSGEGAGRGR